MDRIFLNPVEAVTPQRSLAGADERGVKAEDGTISSMENCYCFPINFNNSFPIQLKLSKIQNLKTLT
ncbi:hypothetical protein GS399_05725 [Pedobacter sp. HMF7647]|uniref:Uncharacterized protein n=1 Tax=Hufsiella arboris TaxID=2695275 RepID=A0A7K1Y7C3_9SPHI|nr:hypothetical protein [Hufsiella arboris]MXV50465.1 hypothetical protein [Hufsiella arboris]